MKTNELSRETCYQVFTDGTAVSETFTGEGALKRAREHARNLPDAHRYSEIQVVKLVSSVEVLNTYIPSTEPRTVLRERLESPSESAPAQTSAAS